MEQFREYHYGINQEKKSCQKSEKKKTGGAFSMGVRFFAFVLALLLLLPLASGCGAGDGESVEAQGKSSLGNGWESEGSLELQYADQFSVDYFAEGFQLIAFADGSRFLLIPEGKEAPEGMDSDIQPLYQPVEGIYLAASSAMSLFDSLNALDRIRFSGTEAEGWYNENARKAMENGEILYAGKYNEPDYELILSQGCALAVESTMINHAPDVKEKLEDLGIPVMIDQSSLENHPLGRAEWLKLYGVLVGQEELAESLFDEQVAYMEQAASGENTGKSVAFFYISSSGYAVVRKPGDYVSKMIELAGGNYVFHDLGGSEEATSSVNMEMEEFYATAKDADFIIYNSAISGELRSLDELIAKNELLQDFKAVQEGNVWCTTKNLYQDTTHLGQMTMEMHRIFTDTAESSGGTAQTGNQEELEFLYKLR